MIKVISFDLDKTLITGDFDNKIWNEELPKHYSKEKNISFEEAKEFCFSKYEEHKGNDQWTSLPFWFNMFGLKDWESLLIKNEHLIILDKDAEPILKKLKGKYKLILVTQNDIEFLEIKLKKIRHYFDEIFSSTHHYKKLKKDALVYNDIIKKLNIKANEMIHVGDDFEFDYEAPKSIGINAILLDPKNEHNEKGSIKNLKEILDMIK